MWSCWYALWMYCIYNFVGKFNWVYFSFYTHVVEEVRHCAVPGPEAEGQVGDDRDGCTDTMNREKEPRLAKHTQTPASPQMTQHMEYDWTIPPPFSTRHHRSVFSCHTAALWKTGTDTATGSGEFEYFATMATALGKSSKDMLNQILIHTERSSAENI